MRLISPQARTGIRSGYFCRIRSASLLRFSGGRVQQAVFSLDHISCRASRRHQPKGCSSLNLDLIVVVDRVVCDKGFECGACGWDRVSEIGEDGREGKREEEARADAQAWLRRGAITLPRDSTCYISLGLPYRAVPGAALPGSRASRTRSHRP